MNERHDNGGKVASGRGARWLAQALVLVGRRPGVFLPMGLIAALIYLVPYLGGLVLLILGPALLAGAVMAARDADRGGRPAIGQMFSLFQEDGRLGQGLRLCLPLVGAQLLATFLIGLPLARAMQRAGIDLKALENQPERLLGVIDGSMLVWFLLALLTVLVGYAFTATAIARVALDRREAFASMRESLRLVRRNLGAWALAGILLFAGMLVLALFAVALGMPALVQVLWYAAIYTVIGPLLYFAWRDLCDVPSDTTSAASPSQVFEA